MGYLYELIMVSNHLWLWYLYVSIMICWWSICRAQFLNCSSLFRFDLIPFVSRLGWEQCWYRPHLVFQSSALVHISALVSMDHIGSRLPCAFDPRPSLVWGSFPSISHTALEKSPILVTSVKRYMLIDGQFEEPHEKSHWMMSTEHLIHVHLMAPLLSRGHFPQYLTLENPQ